LCKQFRQVLSFDFGRPNPTNIQFDQHESQQVIYLSISSRRVHSLTLGRERCCIDCCLHTRPDAIGAIFDARAVMINCQTDSS
jgi:hypothetical protein